MSKVVQFATGRRNASVLQTNNLTDMDALTQAANQATADYDTLQNRIDAAAVRINEINNLQKHIGAYSKNKDIYSQYLRSKRSPVFYKENEKAITTVEAAKAFFNSLGFEKLPSIKDLQAEYSVLAKEKHSCLQARNDMKQYVFDLQSAKRTPKCFWIFPPYKMKHKNKKRKRAEGR